MVPLFTLLQKIVVEYVCTILFTLLYNNRDLEAPIGLLHKKENTSKNPPTPSLQSKNGTYQKMGLRA